MVLSTSAVTLQPKWFQLFHPLRDDGDVSPALLPALWPARGRLWG